MATETWLPNELLASAGMQAFTLADVDEDPNAPDGAWAFATSNNVATSVRVGFSTPSGNPSSVQTFRTWVRLCSTAGTGIPTCTIKLYENGTLLATGSAQNVTSRSGQQFSQAFDLSSITLSDPTGAGVQVETSCSATGGSPSQRSACDIGGFAWDAQYTAGGGGGSATNKIRMIV